MTRTRVLAALLAGLTLAGIGTAASALGSDDPTSAAAPVTVVAQTSTTTPTSTPAAAVTADEAGSRAVARVGGGTVTKVEREVEHGRTVWKVDVRRDTRLTEVHVDVANGAVTRVEDDDRRDDHGRHGGDDGPGHDRFDDKGGDR